MDYAYRIAVEEARVGHDLVTLELPPSSDEDEEGTDEEEEAAREDKRLKAEADVAAAALEAVLRGEGDGGGAAGGDEAAPAASGATTDAMAALMNVSRNKSKQYRAPIIGFLITHDPPEVLKKWHQMALPGILERLKQFNPRYVGVHLLLEQ